MGVGREAMPPRPWIFTHDKNIVTIGLIMLVFVCFCYFSIAPSPPPNFFLPTLLVAT